MSPFLTVRRWLDDRRFFRLQFQVLNAQLVYVLTKCGVLESLDEAKMTSAQLAEKLAIDAVMLSRVLRAGVAFKLLTLGSDGRFGTTRLGRSFQGEWRSIVSEFGDIYYPAWGELLAAVKTGRQSLVELRFGKTIWELRRDDNDFGERFAAGQDEITERQSHKIVAAYDFGSYRRIVDIGGGYGALVRSIMGKNPSVTCVLFDQAQVVELAPKRFSPELRSRCDFVGGDLFGAMPQGGDAYILQKVLHNWNDEECGRILRGLRGSMKQGSKLILLELLQSSSVKKPEILKDLQMLLLEHGRDRTVAEFRTLLEPAGFRVTKAIPRVAPLQGLIEAEAA